MLSVGRAAAVAQQIDAVAVLDGVDDRPGELSKQALLPGQFFYQVPRDPVRVVPFEQEFARQKLFPQLRHRTQTINRGRGNTSGAFLLLLFLRWFEWQVGQVILVVVIDGWGKGKRQSDCLVLGGNVLLQHSIQGPPVESQDPRGRRLVAAASLDHGPDDGALHPFESTGQRHGNGVGVAPRGDRAERLGDLPPPDLPVLGR